MSAGLAAEFRSEQSIADAVRALRGKGYGRFEAYSPFPIAELEDAAGHRTSGIAWVAAIAALVGTLTILGIQYYSAVIAYPLDIGARPSFSWVSALSATVIVTILWGALGAFGAFLYFTGLPRLRHPIFEMPGFDSISDERFFLFVEDPAEGALDAGTAAWLRELGAVHVQRVEA